MPDKFTYTDVFLLMVPLGVHLPYRWGDHHHIMWDMAVKGPQDPPLFCSVSRRRFAGVAGSHRKLQLQLQLQNTPVCCPALAEKCCDADA